jgi:precorrin-2 dehydrogenase/sirohydrochlorin ferrochelatase
MESTPVPQASPSPSPYFPVFLDLRGVLCLVVGGGEVAQRKAEGIRAAGGQVKVVAEVCVGMPEGVELERRTFRESDLEGVSLVFAATDDRAVNAGIAKMARTRNLWVNAVDDPQACSFILPALVRRGDLVIAVSTGGQSPLLARSIKEELEERFGSEYGNLAALLGGRRRAWLEDPRVAPLSYEERRSVWEQILALPLAQWLREGDEPRVLEAVDAILRAALEGSRGVSGS